MSCGSPDTTTGPDTEVDTEPDAEEPHEPQDLGFIRLTVERSVRFIEMYEQHLQRTLLSATLHLSPDSIVDLRRQALVIARQLGDQFLIERQ